MLACPGPVPADGLDTGDLPAVAGRYLKLTENGATQDGWQVAGVGARLAEEVIRERSQDYKHTRQASDI